MNIAALRIIKLFNYSPVKKFDSQRYCVGNWNSIETVLFARILKIKDCILNLILMQKNNNYKI